MLTQIFNPYKLDDTFLNRSLEVIQLQPYPLFRNEMHGTILTVKPLETDAVSNKRSIALKASSSSGLLVHAAWNIRTLIWLKIN